jgi:hypothetical protein
MLEMEARAVLADTVLWLPARLNTLGMLVETPKPTKRKPKVAEGI